jgi:hypothetical protein
VNEEAIARVGLQRRVKKNTGGKRELVSGNNRTSDRDSQERNIKCW